MLLCPEMFADMRKSGNFYATADFSSLADADAITSLLFSPLVQHPEPYPTYVEPTADAIARTLRPQQLVVLESTTYPRATREVMLPRFVARGLKCRTHF